MLALFFFGPPLEERWGSRGFAKFYLVAGLGGAILSLLFWNQTIAGASGAVYGVMVAFAMFWPDNPIYIWGIFPVKAKWLVTFLVGLSLFYAVTPPGGQTAHLAHLGGAMAAFIYLKSAFAPPAWGEVSGRPSRGRSGRPAAKWGLLAKLRTAGRRAKAVESAPVARSAPAPKVRRRSVDEVDRILEKISEGGISSLTPDERKHLEEASKKFRTN
jgi:hypothetical protein